MIFRSTDLPDAAIIDVERHEDERGFLARTYCEREFAEQGFAMPISQSSTIYSPKRHTLRGLHFQEAPYREAKLVRCTRGSAFVVIVDLRSDSPSSGQWLGVQLSALNGRLVYVPEGFAQGYQTLEDDTEMLYHMSQHYVPEAARGVRWNDPSFAIKWPEADQRIISGRDQAWPDHLG